MHTGRPSFAALRGAFRRAVHMRHTMRWDWALYISKWKRISSSVPTLQRPQICYTMENSDYAPIAEDAKQVSTEEHAALPLDTKPSPKRVAANSAGYEARKKQSLSGLFNKTRRAPRSLIHGAKQGWAEDEADVATQGERVLDTIEELDRAMDRVYAIGKLFDTKDYKYVIPECEDSLVDVESLRDRIRDHFKFRFQTERAAEENTLMFPLYAAADMAVFRTKYYMNESRTAMDRAAQKQHDAGAKSP